MKKLLAGLALAVMTMLAMPQQASALSLQNPFGVASKHLSDGVSSQVEQVRFGRGGGHFRGGHFGRGGHFRGFHGGFRGHRGWGGHRGWHRRHFGGPRYFAPRYYYGGYRPIRRCRVVWTYYGPQRICRFRRW